MEACFKKIIPDDEPGAQNRVFLQPRYAAIATYGIDMP